MKKLRFAGALLFAPITLLAACGGVMTNLSFTSNWFANTGLGDANEQTHETLEYTVGFDSTPRDGFSADYSGSYRTELVNKSVDGGAGYLYTTRLDITGHFELNGEKGEPFNDYIETSVEFLSVGQRLRPVKSFKEVKSTSPLSMSPSSLSDGIVEYHYSYAVDYNSDLTEAVSTFIDLKENAEPVKKTFDIEDSTTYLDNEQILFALRGLDLSATTTFRSINPVTEQVAKLRFAAAPTSTDVSAEFEMNGTQVSETIAAYSVDLLYDGSNPGQPQKLFYAKKTDASANVYRNVLLRMEVPVLQTLGTLRYTLSKADFAAK